MTVIKPKKAGTYDNQELLQRERWIMVGDNITLSFAVSATVIKTGVDWIMTPSGREQINAVPWLHYPDYD